MTAADSDHQPSAPNGDKLATWQAQLQIAGIPMKIVLPIILLTLVLAGGGIWLINRSAEQTARVRLTQLAVAVAEQTDRDVQQINDLLDSGARFLSGTNDINRGDTNRLQEQIRPRMIGAPLMRGLVFSDTTGTRRVITRDFNNPLYGFDSKLVLDDYLAHPGTDLFVSPPFQFTTGGTGIPISRAVVGADGELKGLITVLLDASLLTDFYASVDPSGADNIILIRADGMALIGKTTISPAMATALRQQVPGALSRDNRDDDFGKEAAPVDILSGTGDVSFAAAKQISGTPMVALATTDRRFIRHSWLLQGVIVVSVIAVAGLMLLGMALFLRRRIIANERTLQSQADFVNLIIDSAEVMIFVRDRQRRIIRVNQTAERKLGYSAEALNDHNTWLAMLPPDEQDGVVAAFMQNDPKAYPNSHENHVIGRDGEARLFRWSNVAVLDKSGRVSLVIGIGEDITATARARRLQERNMVAMGHAQRLAGLRYCYHSSQSTDSDSQLDSFYAQMSDILGLPLSEVPQASEAFVARFIHPDDQQAALSHYQGFAAGLTDQYLIEYRLLRPDGQIRYIREVTKRLIDAIDNINQSIGVIQDMTDIRQTQLALERHVTLMNRAQTIAKMCYWYFEPSAQQTSFDDGQYYYSENAADIFGLPPAMLNMPERRFAEEVVHPDDREYVFDSYRSFVEGHELKYQRLYRLLLPDGTVRYISDAGEKRLTPDGRLTLILGISQDVTTLHLSEASLRRTESQLRHALRIAGMGHWHAEQSDMPGSGYRMQFSDEAAAIFGVAPGIIGQLDLNGFADRFIRDVEDRTQALTRMERFWSGADTTLSVEFKITHTGGMLRVVRLVAERVMTAHPTSVQMVGMVQDITDLRRRELALLQTEALLQHVHRMAKIGYWLWRPSENLESSQGHQRYSEGLVEMLGIDTDDYYGDDETFCARYVHADDRKHVLQALLDYHRGIKDGYALEYRYTRPDGRMLNLRTAAMRVRDEAGHILYAIGVAQDVTVQKQHEQELIQAKNEADMANRSKTEFLTNMSHELRTPLNAVIGFSQLIKDQAFGAQSDRYVSYAEDINSSGKLLLDLINDILDMSRIEAGRFVLGEETLSLNGAIQDCLRLVSPRAHEGQVRIDYQPAEDDIVLNADARSLKQILLNVLSNAVKFTPQQGCVRIVTEVAADGRLNVTITDTGIGIPAEVLPNLFAPFRQGDNSISRRFGGTGLGLAISRKLIELHGGNVDIESETGQGTSVHLVFPAERVIHPAAVAPSQTQSSQTQASQTQDDEPARSMALGQ
jgi:PAS domain S-box-containing protein